MHVGDHVHAVQQPVGQARALVPAHEFQVPMVACHRVQVGPELHDAAGFLFVHHVAHGVAGDGIGKVIKPVRTLTHDVQRPAYAQQLVHLQQAHHVFVAHVLRRPRALAVAQEVQVFFGDRERPAAAVAFLAACDFVDHMYHPSAQFRRVLLLN